MIVLFYCSKRLIQQLESYLPISIFSSSFWVSFSTRNSYNIAVLKISNTHEHILEKGVNTCIYRYRYRYRCLWYLYLNSILKKKEYYHGFFLKRELDKSHKHKCFNWFKLYWNFDLYMGWLEIWPFAGQSNLQFIGSASSNSEKF